MLTLHVTGHLSPLYWKLTAPPAGRVFLGQQVMVQGSDIVLIGFINHIIRSSPSETIFQVSNNARRSMFEAWICIPHKYLRIGTYLKCVGRRCAVVLSKRLFGRAPRWWTALTLPTPEHLVNFEVYRYVPFSSSPRPDDLTAK